jgi:hypothetical protein
VYDSGGRLADGIALADINGDGKLDILVANTIDGSLGVLPGQGDGTFLPPLTFGFNECLCYSVAITDVNSDGKPDILMSGLGPSDRGTVVVFINSVAGSYSGTMTTLSSSLNPSFYGQAVTFTAQVTSAQGAIPDGEPVTFSTGKTFLASVPLAGGNAVYTTSSLSANSHLIKATYTGDTWHNRSTRTATQVVKKYTTTTALTSSLNPSNFRQGVTFTAHVTSANPSALTGKVKFLDGTTSIGTATLSGGVAKLTKSTLAVGTHPITSQYLGDAASDKSTSQVVNQVVQ